MTLPAIADGQFSGLQIGDKNSICLQAGEKEAGDGQAGQGRAPFLPHQGCSKDTQTTCSHFAMDLKYWHHRRSLGMT